MRLLSPADVFPFASCTSDTMQVDHTEPYRPQGAGGPSAIGNYGPLTQTHHRIKTFGPWLLRQAATTQRYGRHMPAVVVPAARVERWVENFQGRHGATALSIVDGALGGSAEDGSTFTMRLPLEAPYAGLPGAGAFAAAASSCAPGDWGVLLVRKGGFAVARMSGSAMGLSKTGQRHVQGRTKAGGQSQQRFARRRDNQARQAYEAAADHAARILEGLHGPLVVGGDRSAVEEVLADRRLAGASVVEPWLDLPDPRRRILEQGVDEALSVRIDVINA